MMIRKPYLLFKFIFVISVIYILNGCNSLSNISIIDEKNWKNYYNQINHQASVEFVEKAFEEAVKLYGQPSFKINQVYLVRSQKKQIFSHLLIQEDFSLTEVLDSSDGSVVIYIGVDLGGGSYFPLLAHEVFHLLNPYVNDWYMEGMASVFAESYCLKSGLISTDWIENFIKNKKNPYVASFDMMKKIKDISPNAYKSLLTFTYNNSNSELWKKIDINKWLDTLKENERKDVIKIIKSYENVLKRKTDVAFTIPREYTVNNLNLKNME